MRYYIFKSKLIVAMTFGLLFSFFSSQAQFRATEADSLLNDFFDSSLAANRDSAIVVVDQLIQHFSIKKDYSSQIEAMLLQHRNFAYKADFSKALSLVQEAQKIFNTENCKPELQANLSLALSAIHYYINNYAKSDSIALQAIKDFKEEWPNKETLVKFYLYLNNSAENNANILLYLDTGLALARKYNLDTEEQEALINLGNTYAQMDSLEKSKEYLMLALEVALSRKSFYDLPSLYSNLAGLASDPEERGSYLDSAFRYAVINGNLEQRLVCLQNMAFHLSLIGEPEKAYSTLYQFIDLKDTLLNAEKYKAVTEMEQKYEAEKKSNEIKSLKLENLEVELESITYKKNQNLLLLGTAVLLLAAGFLTFGLFNIRKNRNKLAIKNVQISEAKKRSDELLLNILPAKIAEELKEFGKAEAQHFETISILFTDFKGFTALAELLSPKDLVEEINHCFEGFDYIVEKYQIEKIKTIGDAYMAAGGLPIPFPLSISNTVLAALEMQAFIKARKIENDKVRKPSFSMRVGIHTGQVVAGIVGVKKFQYDIWGDTVNTASRMESSGEVDKVNISLHTYNLIKDDASFSFESRGKIEAKGKGEMEMWFVSLKS